MESSAADSTPATAPGGSVLVVDDEEPVRNVARAFLGHLGYASLGAASGAEALAAFEGCDSIRCVLLDLAMPGMDARKTLEALRQRCPELPVLLMSGFATRLADELLSLERVGFLQKPFSMPELSSALRERLGVGLPPGAPDAGGVTGAPDAPGAP